MAPAVGAKFGLTSIVHRSQSVEEHRRHGAEFMIWAGFHLAILTFWAFMAAKVLT